MHRSKPRIAILVLCAMALPYQPSVAASRVYETEDYGLRLRAPQGRIVCPGLSWTHVHGFGYNIRAPWNCRKNTDRTSIGAVGIWADFNVVPWSLRHAARITCKGRPFALNSTQLARINFRGRRTLHCAVIDKGDISIHALAEQGWSPDMHASCVQYDAYLITQPSQLERDLPAFEAFLKNVTIKRVTCS